MAQQVTNISSSNSGKKGTQIATRNLLHITRTDLHSNLYQKSNFRLTLRFPPQHLISSQFSTRTKVSHILVLSTAAYKPWLAIGFIMAERHISIYSYTNDCECAASLHSVEESSTEVVPHHD